MENLELNNKEATVGVNGQEEREARLRHLIFNKCKYAYGYASDDCEIIDKFLEQIQNIDPSYTKEEIREVINKLYQEKYREMFYDDFITCLAHKNATVEDYENVLYKYNMFKTIARIYAYYSIASRESIIKDKNDAIFDLVYDAYKSASTSLGKLIEEEPEEMEDMIYHALSKYIDDEDLLEKLVEKTLKTIKVTYEGSFYNEGLEYEPLCSEDEDKESCETTQYQCWLYTEVTVKYVFDTNTVKEIEQILAKYNATLDDAITIDYNGYNDTWQGDEALYYEHNPWKNEYAIVKIQDIPEEFTFDYEELIEHNKNNEDNTVDNILS